MPGDACYFEGRKFMWDGKMYETRAEAEAAQAAYEQESFETHVMPDDGKFRVYSRRMAAEQAATSS